jgi:hypothetical protein
MKYFTDDLMERVHNRATGTDSEIREAFHRYKPEFDKAKKKLPKEFLEIYKTCHGFHDAGVPSVSILTEYPGFTAGVERIIPSRLRMIIVNAYAGDMVYEINIDAPKEIEFRFWGEKFPGCLYDYIYDEILTDGTYVSWEIQFSVARLKIVFRSLSARQLSKQEAEGYKRPIITDGAKPADSPEICEAGRIDKSAAGKI